MKDCWKILGLSKTMDRELLRQHYRSLVKKFHPDLVKEPELKRRNTIKLQKIITAYEEASRQIELSRITDDNIVTTRKSEEPAKDLATSRKKSNIIQTVLGLFTLITFPIILATFLVAISIAIKKIVSLPPNHPVGLTFHIMVGIIGSSLIGLFVGSLVYFLVLISSGTIWKILDKTFNIQRHAFKIAWIFTIIINIYIFRGVTGGQHVWMYFIQALAFPSLLLAIWINDLIKYKKTMFAIKPLENITDLIDKY